jgi:hypothetical protein
MIVCISNPPFKKTNNQPVVEIEKRNDTLIKRSDELRASGEWLECITYLNKNKKNRSPL